MTESYKKAGLPKEKLIQIPQGVDVNQYYPLCSKYRKNEIRKKLMCYGNSKIAVFVGAIIKRKGVDLLIEAWRSVERKIKNSTLLLIGPDTFHGDDPEINRLNKFSNEMKQIVTKSNLNIKFIGRTDRVAIYLKAADLFVLPSELEGMPNAVIEAMATGIPVIITEMKGVAYDLIESGIEGFIVNDSKELANKIIYLFENEDISIEMGKRGREKILKNFNLEVICKKYLTLYNSLFIKVKE
jgi:glycosyltransferase involved in cell wall biosynthesis